MDSTAKEPKDWGTIKAEQIWKDNVRREDTCREKWNSSWSWLVEEFAVREERLLALEAERIGTEHRKRKDKRTVKPFPETTQREYGWLVSKEEFALEVVGPYPVCK